MQHNKSRVRADLSNVRVDGVQNIPRSNTLLPLGHRLNNSFTTPMPQQRKPQRQYHHNSTTIPQRYRQTIFSTPKRYFN